MVFEMLWLPWSGGLKIGHTHSCETIFARFCGPKTQKEKPWFVDSFDEFEMNFFASAEGIAMWGLQLLACGHPGTAGSPGVNSVFQGRRKRKKTTNCWWPWLKLKCFVLQETLTVPEEGGLVKFQAEVSWCFWQVKRYESDACVCHHISQI